MRKPAIAILAAATLALLSACSSQSGADTVGSSNLKGQPIKVIDIVDNSATLAQGDAIKAGAKAAASAINASGGVGGRPLEITYCEGGDPNALIACARDAASGGYVAAVAPNSTDGDQWIPLLYSAEIPTVGGFPFSQAEQTNKLSFPLTGGPLDPTGVGYSLAETQGVKKILMAELAIPPATIAAEQAKAGVSNAGGKVVGSVSVAVTQSDLTSVVTQAMKQKVDGIATVLTTPGVASLLKAADQLGYTGKISIGGNASYELASLPAAAEGSPVSLLFPLASKDSSNPGVKSFLADMQKYQAAARINQATMNGWGSVKLLALAAEKALGKGDVDGESIAKALESGDKFDIGILPALQYKTPSHAISGYTRLFNTSMYAGVIEHGKVVMRSDKPFDPTVSR